MKKFNQMTEKQMANTNGGLFAVLVVGGLALAGSVGLGGAAAVSKKA